MAACTTAETAQSHGIKISLIYPSVLVTIVNYSIPSIGAGSEIAGRTPASNTPPAVHPTLRYEHRSPHLLRRTSRGHHLHRTTVLVTTSDRHPLGGGGTTPVTRTSMIGLDRRQTRPSEPYFSSSFLHVAPGHGVLLLGAGGTRGSRAGGGRWQLGYLG